MRRAHSRDGSRILDIMLHHRHHVVAALKPAAIAFASGPGRASSFFKFGKSKYTSRGGRKPRRDNSFLDLSVGTQRLHRGGLDRPTGQFERKTTWPASPSPRKFWQGRHAESGCGKDQSGNRAEMIGTTRSREHYEGVLMHDRSRRVRAPSYVNAKAKTVRN